MTLVIKQLAERLCDHSVFSFVGAERYSKKAVAGSGWWTGPKIKTYTAYLENVFGRYWEGKGEILKYSDISENYSIDWDNFLNDMKIALRKNSPFHAICPVAYIRLQVEDESSVVIEDILIRPCAIAHGFLETIIRTIAETIGDRTLILKILDAPHILIDKLLNSYCTSDDYIREEVYMGGEDANYYIQQTARINFRGPKQYTYTFVMGGLRHLCSIPIIHVPMAHSLNSFDNEDDTSKERNELIKEMATDPNSATFSGILNYFQSNDTNFIMFDIHEKETLQIYKDGKTEQYISRD